MSKARADLFQHMRKVVTNLQANEELAKAAAAVGVDAAMVGRGRALLDRSEQKHQQHQRLTKEFKRTAAALKSTRKVLWALFRSQRRLAQLVITDADIRTQLDLDDYLETTQVMQLEQCRSFYTSVLDSAAILAAVADAGLTRQKLEVGQTLIAELDQLITSEISLRATKEQATLELRLQIKEVRAWLHATTTLARFGTGAHSPLLKAISHEVRKRTQDEEGDEE